jgi:hypothetical protein
MFSWRLASEQEQGCAEFARENGSIETAARRRRIESEELDNLQSPL